MPGICPFLIATGVLFINKVHMFGTAFLLIPGLLIASFAFLMSLSLAIFNPQKMIGYFDGFARISGLYLLRIDEDENYRKILQVHADLPGWNEITENTAQAWSQVTNKNKSFILRNNRSR